MLAFDGAHTTSYWCAILTMALSCVLLEIFNVENTMSLNYRSEVTKGNWKWWHLIVCYGVLLVIYNNFVPKPETLDCKYIVTLKPGLGVTQGHWNRHVSTHHIWLPISDHSNHGPISHGFRHRRQFQSNIQVFPIPLYFAWFGSVVVWCQTCDQ